MIDTKLCKSQEELKMQCLMNIIKHYYLFLIVQFEITN